MRPCPSRSKSGGDETMSSVPQNQNAQHSNNMAAEIVTPEDPFKLGTAQLQGQTHEGFVVCGRFQPHEQPTMDPLHEPVWRCSVFEEHPNERWIGSVGRLAARCCASPHALPKLIMHTQRSRGVKLVEPMKPTGGTRCALSHEGTRHACAYRMPVCRNRPCGLNLRSADGISNPSPCRRRRRHLG